ncbi:MAG: HK97-gp10 family putative phage morphogenesis protein [Bacillota bacterium]
MSGAELQGVDQMLASIRQKLSSGVQRLENQGLRAAGEILASAQREKVVESKIDRVHSVHIKEDIRVSNVRRDGYMGERYVLVGTSKKTSWRVHFEEFGTKKTPARPFIYPSFHENKDRITQLFAAVLKGGMR